MRPTILTTLAALLFTISIACTPGIRKGPAANLAPRAVAPPAAKPARPTHPDEAHRWRESRWRDENGRIAPDAWRQAVAQRQAIVAHWAEAGLRGTAGIAPENWVERGPDNVGGRTRALVIDPDDPNHMLAGAVSGGIWVSYDRGASWAPVNDWMSNLAICCLAMDPADPDVLYAGTGEGFFNGDAIGGNGIYKSIDRGATWTRLPSTADWDTVNRIAVSPDDGNVLLAAKRYGGIQRSADGGDTWSDPYPAQGSYYVAFHPSDGTKAIAQVLDYDWDAADWFHAAMYSTDGGVSWTAATGLDQVWSFYSRLELAYAPSNPSVVYASNAADGGIWRSTNGGQSYTAQTTSGNSGVNWYANPLWVDPTNANFLVTGGYDFYKSPNAGVALSQISAGYMMSDQPHVDNHFIVHDPRFDGVTNRRVYVCTDGGTWCTDNIYTASTGSGWYRRDQSYRTTQFYGAAGDGPSGRLVGGTQDNGTQVLNAGSNQSNLMFGGDGGFCAIDPTNPNYCYGEYINLQIHRSTNGGVSASYIWNGIGDAGTGDANFIAPFILDPNDPNTMLAGGSSLWRSNNVKQVGGGGPDWEAIRGPGADNISAIAVAPGNSDVIWIGLNNGQVHRTENGTAATPTWIIVDNNVPPKNPLPNRYVERILIDPDDQNVVYVALGGFAANNLWRNTAAGVGAWTDITGDAATGLPSAPINGLARHPDRSDFLYVGTEVGIFATADGGATWSANNEGPADASVDELVFLHNSATLLAATHGRGLFTADLTLPPFDYDFNGTIDLSDHRAFTQCLTGPGGGLLPNCGTFDHEDDTDVDLPDFQAFQNAFDGA